MLGVTIIVSINGQDCLPLMKKYNLKVGANFTQSLSLREVIFWILIRSDIPRMLYTKLKILQILNNFWHFKNSFDYTLVINNTDAEKKHFLLV